MIDYSPFLSNLQQFDALQPLYQQAAKLIETGLDKKRYGDLAKWYQALERLPKITTAESQLNQAAVAVSNSGELDRATQDALLQNLKALHPWRKGPFDLFGTTIDTEWRSDLKWDRLLPHISPLTGRVVLDVGCGSGYHCWRARGEGAELVVGIDPTPLFIVQFYALQTYIQDHHVGVLPARMEQLPEKLAAFDTVSSMGVLYHRRSPLDHLQELYNALKPGGELVLETLVVDGEEGYSLMPRDRYSRMGNVWFLPSTATLTSWLHKLRFTDIHVADISVTTSQEQRRTEWMQFHSLTDFLDPDDPGKTIEGYPAPKRAILIARRP